MPSSMAASRRISIGMRKLSENNRQLALNGGNNVNM